jgi:hypothetical protein
MHYIAQTPTNLQGYGFCSKDSTVTLRLGDGTNINTSEGFTGSWGGDVARYTT